MILACQKLLGQITKVLGFGETPLPRMGKTPKKSRIFFLTGSLIILMQMSLITLMSMVVMMWVGWMNVAGLNMGHVLVPGSVKVRGLGSSLPNCPLCLPTSDNDVFHRLTAAKLFGQGQLSAIIVNQLSKISPNRVFLSYHGPQMTQHGKYVSASIPLIPLSGRGPREGIYS